MTAKGEKAFGFCDRTGFRYPLKELVTQYKNGKPTGLKVGKDVVDIDHEQLRIGDLNISEEESLDDPRTDTAQTVSRALAAFDPVGGGVTYFGSRTVGLNVGADVGVVAVS